MLESDHKTVKKLLKQLSKTEEDSVDERGELLEQIEAELKVHTQIEEEIFYPEFREAAGENDTHLYFEAVEEHRLVDIVLPELKETDPSSEEFAARAKVLLDLVEHHIEEEEGQLFPKARKALGSTRLRELGQSLMERKEELQGGMMEMDEERSSQRGARSASKGSGRRGRRAA
jgi:hemerythrin-like domain-containing protein